MILQSTILKDLGIGKISKILDVCIRGEDSIILSKNLIATKKTDIQTIYDPKSLPKDGCLFFLFISNSSIG